MNAKFWEETSSDDSSRGVVGSRGEHVNDGLGIGAIRPWGFE